MPPPPRPDTLAPFPAQLPVVTAEQTVRERACSTRPRPHLKLQVPEVMPPVLVHNLRDAHPRLVHDQVVQAQQLEAPARKARYVPGISMSQGPHRHRVGSRLALFARGCNRSFGIVYGNRLAFFARGRHSLVWHCLSCQYTQEGPVCSRYHTRVSIRGSVVGQYMFESCSIHVALLVGGEEPAAHRRLAAAAATDDDEVMRLDGADRRGGGGGGGGRGLHGVQTRGRVGRPQCRQRPQ